MANVGSKEFMPEISIIIPVYNKAIYIEDTIQSALAQTFSSIEILVVNDGSEDGSGEVCEKIAGQDTRIVYWEQPNQGVVAARNNAIKKAKGKYIFPLDADDLIVPDCLEKMYRAIESNEVDVVYSYVSRKQDGSSVMRYPEVGVPSILVKNCVPVSALFRRSEWERYGGYRSNMSGGLEDWDFWLNFVEDGRKFLLISEPLLFWRPVDGSRNKMASANKKSMIKNIVANHAALYRPYRNKLMYYMVFRVASWLRFIDFFGHIREKLKIYAHIRKYG